MEIKFSEIKRRRHNHHLTNHTLNWLGTNILGNLGDVDDTWQLLEVSRNVDPDNPDLESIRAQQRFGIHQQNLRNIMQRIQLSFLPKLDIKCNENHKLLLEHKTCPICQIDFIDGEISTDDELEQLLLADGEQDEEKKQTSADTETQMEQEDIFKMMDKSRKINQAKKRVQDEKFSMNYDNLNERMMKELDAGDKIVNLYDNDDDNGNDHQTENNDMIDIGNELIASNGNELTLNSDLVNVNENGNNALVVNEWSATNNVECKMNENERERVEMNENRDSDTINENETVNENEEDITTLKSKITKCKGGDVNCESIARLWCGHMFHTDCVIPWLSKQNTCPLCRYELPSNNPTYELKRRVETYDYDGIYQIMT